MGKHPLWLNFSDPTILHVGNQTQWDDDALSNLAVVNELNANTNDSWIYLLITATKFPFGVKDRQFAPAFHPVSPTLPTSSRSLTSKRVDSPSWT